MRAGLLAALLAATAPPQAPPQEPNPPIQERVEVQLRLVNFIATDRRGAPVLDLRPEEIEILEGRVPQKLAFLEREGTIPGPPPPASPSVPAASSPPPQGRVRGRWLVLVFDNELSDPRTRIKSVQAARAFFEGQLQPQDRVAVAALSGRLELLQTFTADKTVLAAALDKVTGATRATEDRAAAVDELLDAMMHCRDLPNAGSCAQRATGVYEDSRAREARDFVLRLLELTRALGPIDDTKAVILFSNGFTRTPYADAFDAARATLGFPVARSLSPTLSTKLDRDFDELAAAAAQARVSFFTINPGGGTRNSAISASRGTLSETVNPEMIDVYRRGEQNAQQGLVELARRTGGRATQGNDPAAQLSTMAGILPGLYTAGYYPTASGNGQVKIRVLRRGVEVDARRDLVFASPPPPLTGDLQILADACPSSGRRTATLKLRLDRHRLQFEKIGEQYVSNFALEVRILDEGRTPLFADFRYLNITNSADEMRKGGQPDPAIEQTFVVPCRPLTVTASAADTLSGARGTFSAAIPLP